MQPSKQSRGRAGGASEPTFTLCNWSDSTRVKLVRNWRMVHGAASIN